MSNGAVNCCCRYLRLPPPTYLHNTDHLYHNKGASYNGKLIVPAVKVKVNVKVPLEATTRQDPNQRGTKPRLASPRGSWPPNPRRSQPSRPARPQTNSSGQKTCSRTNKPPILSARSESPKRRVPDSASSTSWLMLLAGLSRSILLRWAKTHTPSKPPFQRHLFLFISGPQTTEAPPFLSLPLGFSPPLGSTDKGEQLTSWIPFPACDKGPGGSTREGMGDMKHDKKHDMIYDGRGNGQVWPSRVERIFRVLNTSNPFLALNRDCCMLTVWPSQGVAPSRTAENKSAVSTYTTSTRSVAFCYFGIFPL